MKIIKISEPSLVERVLSKSAQKPTFDPRQPHESWTERMKHPGRPSFGGIVMRNDENSNIQVLMRIPMNNYGDHSWTFAKGGVEPHLNGKPEAAYETAINEVGDEFGIENPEPIGHIPLTNENSKGTTGWTGWYLMRGQPTVKPKVNPSLGYAETEQVRWMTIPEAQQGIKETLDKFHNAAGYQRDMAILADAVREYKQWMESQKKCHSDSPSGCKNL